MLDKIVFACLVTTMVIAAITHVIATKAPRKKQLPKELVDAAADYGIKPYPGESLRSFKRAIAAARKERARVIAKYQRSTPIPKDTTL